MKDIKKIKVKYADDRFGNNMSNERGEKEYIGYPKKEEATEKDDFEWYRIVGSKKYDNDNEEILLIERQKKKTIISIIADGIACGCFISGDILFSFGIVAIIEMLFHVYINNIGKILLVIIFTILLLRFVIKYSEE